MDTDEYTEEEIQYAFRSFVTKAGVLVEEYYDDQYPRLDKPLIDVMPGRTYWKIVKGSDENGWSVYGFVRKSDGAIFKAASWKQPFTKGPSAVRGYVTDMSNGMDSITPYGVKYAQ